MLTSLLIFCILGCPFKKTEVPTGEPKECVPKIALPICMTGCSVDKTITVKEIPMKCPGVMETVFKPDQIPVKCTCQC